jgi:hypothetical protein
MLNIKSVLKWVFIVLLIIVCPPLGFAVMFCINWQRLESNRGREIFWGILVGILISFMVSTCLITTFYSWDTLYDSPKVNASEHSFDFLSFSAIFYSPVFFHFASPSETRVHFQDSGVSNADEDYGIVGNDVIVFNADAGKYVLNFEKDRAFWYNDFDRTSVQAAQNEVDKCELLLQGQMKQGNLLKAEEASKNLRAGQNYLEKRVMVYGNLRIILEKIVNGMNERYSKLKTAGVQPKSIKAVEPNVTAEKITPEVRE